MDVLLAIVLILTIPTFYIVGLVVSFRWVARRGRTSLEHDRSVLAHDIQAYSMSKEGSLRNELQYVAATLARGLPLTSVVPPAHRDAVMAEAAHAQTAPTQKSTDSKDWTQKDVLSGLKAMDNINLLLYLGAFLIVVSAGIFVGYNFVTLSGVFKTCFLGLFALVFYSLGLYLYLNLPKLKPAGTTFTGIGLVLLPLVGAAAYNFTSAHAHGSLVWFITSLVTLICYGATLTLTRQTYVSYLMAFTTLSLFESGIALVQAPVYWYGWGLTVGSLVLLSLSRWKNMWQDTKTSLTITANIFVPLSLLFSIAQTNNTGPRQLGVTFGLSAIFYLVMAIRFARDKYGIAYWAAALSALPLALGFGLWDSLPHSQIAAILVLVSAGYVWLGFTPSKEITPMWRRALGLVAGLLPFAGALVEVYHPYGLLSCLLSAVIINAVFARRLKDPALALLTIAAALAVPYVLLRQVMNPAQSMGNLAISYLALSAVLVWYRHQLNRWPQAANAVGAAGYLVAMLFALLAAQSSGNMPTLLTALAVAAGLYYVNVLENAPELIYVSLGVLAFGLCQLTALYNWDQSSIAVILLLTGAVSYATGLVVPNQKQSLALRQGGIVLPFIGALYAVSDTSPANAYALAVSGALLLVEGYKRKLMQWTEVAVAIVIIAFDWYLMIKSFSNAQVTFLPWAAYFGWLAWNRRAGGHQAYDVLVAFALSALTLPIAGQALGDNGSLYGLELILIGIGLVVAGMSIHYKLVTYWGAATLVAEVLYQMRSVIFALPKYLISAVLGLGLLAVAIVLLQRRRPDQ